MSDTGYYLLDHPNSHAKASGDGPYQFHGYRTRSKSVRCIVVHTAESTPDTVAADGGAEAVARYQAGVVRPSSYHDLVDSDSHVRMLPWDFTAFQCRNANSWSIGLSMATKAALWPTMPPSWTEATLNNLATVTASAIRWTKAKYGIVIPVTKITKTQAENGVPGITAHGTLDPGRRSDPGATFPWGRFLSKVGAKLGQQPPSGGLDLSAEAEKQIQGIYDAIYKGVPQYGQGAILGVTNQANYSLAGIGDKSIRVFIQDQDKATRRVAHADAVKILEAVNDISGPGGGPLSDADVDRIAEKVADEMSERLRT